MRRFFLWRERILATLLLVFVLLAKRRTLEERMFRNVQKIMSKMCSFRSVKFEQEWRPSEPCTQCPIHPWLSQRKYGRSVDTTLLMHDELGSFPRLCLKLQSWIHNDECLTNTSLSRCLQYANFLGSRDRSYKE